MSVEPWIAVATVAKHLTVAKNSIFRWIDNLQFPSYGVGRLWEFKLSRIGEWALAAGATHEVNWYSVRSLRKTRLFATLPYRRQIRGVMHALDSHYDLEPWLYD